MGGWEDGWITQLLYFKRVKLHKSYICKLFTKSNVILIEHISIREVGFGVIFKGFFKPILCYIICIIYKSKGAQGNDVCN